MRLKVFSGKERGFIRENSESRPYPGLVLPLGTYPDTGPACPRAGARNQEEEEARPGTCDCAYTGRLAGPQ